MRNLIGGYGRTPARLAYNRVYSREPQPGAAATAVAPCRSFVPGSACVACLQTATCCTQLDICSLGFICTGHGSNASIGLDALRKLLVDLNHRIADLVNLIALPRNGQEHLPAPAPPSHDGTPSNRGRETPAP
jgi:hypothetical protein